MDRHSFRWRNDAELASFAWSNYGKTPDVSQINMLMTENRVPMAGPMSCYNSDGSGSSSSCNGAPRDPSLLVKTLFRIMNANPSNILGLRRYRRLMAL